VFWALYIFLFASVIFLLTSSYCFLYSPSTSSLPFFPPLFYFFSVNSVFLASHSELKAGFEPELESEVGFEPELESEVGLPELEPEPELYLVC